jgi:hypothetical protein
LSGKAEPFLYNPARSGSPERAFFKEFILCQLMQKLQKQMLFSQGVPMPLTGKL